MLTQVLLFSVILRGRAILKGDLTTKGPNYGSWVSARLLYAPGAIRILLAGLSFLLPVLAVFAVILQHR